MINYYSHSPEEHINYYRKLLSSRALREIEDADGDTISALAWLFAYVSSNQDKLNLELTENKKRVKTEDVYRFGLRRNTDGIRRIIPLPTIVEDLNSCILLVDSLSRRFDIIIDLENENAFEEISIYQRDLITLLDILSSSELSYKKLIVLSSCRSKNVDIPNLKMLLEGLIELYNKYLQILDNPPQDPLNKSYEI